MSIENIAMEKLAEIDVAAAENLDYHVTINTSKEFIEGVSKLWHRSGKFVRKIITTDLRLGVKGFMQDCVDVATVYPTMKADTPLSDVQVFVYYLCMNPYSEISGEVQTDTPCQILQCRKKGWTNEIFVNLGAGKYFGVIQNGYWYLHANLGGHGKNSSITPPA
jgi:hypothetical protein